MKWKTFIVGCALYLAIFLFAQRRTNHMPTTEFRAVVDLTHALSESNPNWEGTAESPFVVKTLGNIDQDGYFSRYISTQEHFGTHLDAPAHFGKGGWTVEQIPPERLVGPLVVLDVRAKVKGDGDYQVSLDDVADWEQKHGHIPPGAIVMANTGWASRWHSMQQYRNADASGLTHWPGYAPETAQFLVEGRNVFGLGIDTMGVDYGASQDYPIHQYTAKRGVYHVENVADMSLVPETGAIAIVSPMKLEGGSGAPTRIYALIR